MASFKALCLAGVASLAAMTVAHAADLLPPPPPVEYAPPAPAVIGGGWYLRGDVGLGIADLNQRQSTTSTVVNDFQINQSTLDDSAFLDAGIGYRFNQYFRADVTGEYRGSAHFSAIESYSTNGFCNNGRNCRVPRGYDSYSGQFQSIAGLVNGYVDAGTWYGFTPFAGAGVGIARVGVNNVSDFGTVSDPYTGAPGGFGYTGSHYQTNFAFALMAGLDFNVTNNLTMELGYRYLDMGRVSSGVIGCVPPSTCVNEVQHFHLASNDIRLGFRYAFTDFVPAFSPQLPLIRKY